MSADTDHLLKVALACAVPMWLEELKDKSIEFLLERASICSKHVADYGDNIFFKSEKIGETAEAFNRLAEGIAVLFLVTRHDLPEEIFGQKECPGYLKK